MHLYEHLFTLFSVFSQSSSEASTPEILNQEQKKPHPLLRTISECYSYSLNDSVDVPKLEKDLSNLEITSNTLLNVSLCSNSNVSDINKSIPKDKVVSSKDDASVVPETCALLRRDNNNIVDVARYNHECHLSSSSIKTSCLTKIESTDL